MIHLFAFIGILILSAMPVRQEMEKGLPNSKSQTGDKTDPKQADKKARVVDVVFAIDCSGSMGPVIETAKQKVWSIVNTMAKETPKPIIRIGLFAYGNADKDARLYDLSDDLDEVYKNLMNFKDEGWGTEWVGWAVKQATDKMKWSSEKNALKVIFVVGNETARQGPKELDYSKTAPEAIKKSIIVNAVYCATPSEKPDPTWIEMAKLADGTFVAIDQSGGSVSIETPMDKELSELSKKLNDTYIHYGDSGKTYKDNQTEQDNNSFKHGGLANDAERACQKVWSYDCSRWDLVDAMKNKDFKLEDIKKETLPKELQSKSLEELRSYIATKSKERDELQAKIKDLGEKRQKFIDEEIKKRNLDDSKSLDKNLKEIILHQMRK